MEQSFFWRLASLFFLIQGNFVFYIKSLFFSFNFSYYTTKIFEIMKKENNTNTSSSKCNSIKLSTFLRYSLTQVKKNSIVDAWLGSKYASVNITL